MTIVMMAVVMLLGCGGEAITPDPSCGAGGAPPGAAASSSSSGGGPTTRLRALLATTDDGFARVLPDRIWDSERQEECSFSAIVEDSGTKTRCLPRYEWAAQGWYVDAACTQRLHLQDQCGDLAAYVRDEAVAAPWQTCSLQALDVLYPLGEQLPADATIYALLGANCTAQTGTFDPVKTAVRPLLDPIPIGEFVEAKVAPEVP